MSTITIALAKGALLEDGIRLLQSVGIDFSGFLDGKNRLLRIPSPTSPDGHEYEALLVRTHDVPVYVEYGQAQLGIVGYDVLREKFAHSREASVAQLLDLGFGYCRLSIATLQDGPYAAAVDLPPYARVASKFVGCARRFFEEMDLPVEVIPLYGSVELAPLTGMADAIVDLVATGRTLKENGLVECDCLFESTARLIAHPITLRSEQDWIQSLVARLRERIPAFV